MRWFRLLLIPLVLLSCLNVQAESAADKRAIVVDLQLDESLQEFSDRDWLLYVFARGENGRVPLASSKLRLKQLPLTISLTEKMFLLEHLTLAKVDQVYVFAKVSRDGDPHRTVVGDLLGKSELVDFSRGSHQQVKLVIDKLVK